MKIYYSRIGFALLSLAVVASIANAQQNTGPAEGSVRLIQPGIFEITSGQTPETLANSEFLSPAQIISDLRLPSTANENFRIALAHNLGLLPLDQLWAEGPVMGIRRGESVALVPKNFKEGSPAVLMSLSPIIRFQRVISVTGEAVAKLQSFLDDGETGSAIAILKNSFDGSPTRTEGNPVNAASEERKKELKARILKFASVKLSFTLDDAVKFLKHNREEVQQAFTELVAEQYLRFDVDYSPKTIGDLYYPTAKGFIKARDLRESTY